MKIKRAELSRLLNISRVSITKAVKSGRLSLTDFGKIDTESLDNFKYLDDHGLFNKDEYNDSPKSKLDRVNKVTNTKDSLSSIQIKKELEGMNFDDLYNDSLWAGKNLKILKDRESTLAERARRKKIEISNSHYRGLLIDRKLVEAHVINYLNVLSSQLFDTADSVSNDVLNILQTYKNQNEAVIKIKKLIIDKVSILIKDTKQIIKNNLNKIGGYDNEQK